MENLYSNRLRNIFVVSLSDLPTFQMKPMPFSTVLPTLISNFRQLLLKSSSNASVTESNISQHIEAIIDQIKQLSNRAEPTEIFDALTSTLDLYIKDLLSIQQCSSTLVTKEFQAIFAALYNVESSLDLASVYENQPLYARTICYRTFDSLTLPLIQDFLTGQCPRELFAHLYAIVNVLLVRIQQTLGPIFFKKNDFEKQVPVMHQLLEFMDQEIKNYDENERDAELTVFFDFFWNVSDETMLVPNLIQADCHIYVLKWISMPQLPLNLQVSCIQTVHNLTRHEKGVKALNEAQAIPILKGLKERVLDPNKSNMNETYTELRLVYCMAFSLLSEPKETQEDLNNLRPVLDQLVQVTINAGQAKDNKYDGFHLSEPLVVLTKMCLNDEILRYVMQQCSVRNLQAKSKIDFFCKLLIQFRGALAGDNEIDQLTLLAVFNILWSISFHDEYTDELKSNTKVLMTIKSLIIDKGDNWVEQYIPRHMSSIAKAANGILWNLDVDNPARPARAPGSRPSSATNAADSAAKDGSTNNKISVMVSYCHADSTFCHQLVEGLEKEKRLSIWVDFAHCHTEDLWEEIGQAIENSQVILFLMSKDYQNSKSCRQEVMYAKDSLQKRFIPIFVQKDFVPSGWLGVRIAGPQYIRFGKRSVDETIKELIQLILDEKTTAKPTQPTLPSPVVETKPVGSAEEPKKPEKPPHEEPEATPTEPPNKPIEQWTKKEISQWSAANRIDKNLLDLYQFARGNDLLLYRQCLQPDWQHEYNDIRQRYQEKYDKTLYRDQFVRLVGAINELRPTPSAPVKPEKSKSCVIV